jgi:hypothetical protein
MVCSIEQGRKKKEREGGPKPKEGQLQAARNGEVAPLLQIWADNGDIAALLRRYMNLLVVSRCGYAGIQPASSQHPASIQPASNQHPASIQPAFSQHSASINESHRNCSLHQGTLL